MTWANRIKLWVGVVVIIALVAGLTLLFNQRQNQVLSAKANIQSSTSVVGSDYGGVVTQQFVERGADVKEGQPLFTLTSLSLQQDVANGIRPQSTPAYDVDADAGTVTYKAVATGYVDQMDALPGTFLPNGHQMATIVPRGERYVIADFAVEPSDYGRMEQGSPARIFLPNNQVIEGKAVNVSVLTTETGTVARVKIASDELTDPKLESLTRLGTPVSAAVELRDDGILSGPTQSMLEFLTRVGLR